MVSYLELPWERIRKDLPRGDWILVAADTKIALAQLLRRGYYLGDVYVATRNKRTEGRTVYCDIYVKKRSK